MGRLSPKWKLGHLVVVHRCIICTAYVPLCSAWNTILLLCTIMLSKILHHKESSDMYITPKTEQCTSLAQLVLHICILYILVVLQMHASCWPLCTCHEWQKYSQSFSVGQRKKENKQPCNKREQYAGLTQIPSQVSNLEETRKSWSGRNVLGGWG